MADIANQVPTLIGVAIGALTTFLAGARAERIRWRHEQTSRLDERRADAYDAYASAIKDVYVECLDIAANLRGLGVQRKIMDEAQALAKLDRLTRERTTKWEAVRLIGSTDTVRAGHQWHTKVYEMECFARDERTGAGEWNAVVKEVNKRRDRFTAAARLDLGVKDLLDPSERWGDAEVSEAEEDPSVPRADNPSSLSVADEAALDVS